MQATSANRDSLLANNIDIFLISVFGLYLELVLIRWIGTELRIFAYLQNTVLVTCFLGLGLGCLMSSKPVNLTWFFRYLTLLIALLGVPLLRAFVGEGCRMLSVLSDFAIWEGAQALTTQALLIRVVIGALFTVGLLWILVGVFFPIGQILGASIDRHPKVIQAYTVNIAGSLIGTWAFVLLSVWKQTPLVWIVVAVVLLLLLLMRLKQIQFLNLLYLVAILLLSVGALHEEKALEIDWSPYQKLTLRPPPIGEDTGEYTVMVNNVGYQAIVDLSKETVAERSEQYSAHVRKGYSQYDIPYLLHPAPKKVLIVGAGTGNDVAGALRNGVEQIVAVDIDPVIVDLGQRFHPEKPYSSPKVKVVVDDARSFFATSDEKFDLIVFGLLDAHTMVSLTNARLDHYVYTRESIERARDLLAQNGSIVLTFKVQESYIGGRIANTLKQVFSEPALVFSVPRGDYWEGGMVFVAGSLAQVTQKINQQPELKSFIDEWQSQDPAQLDTSVLISSDDWPYLYLDAPRIPIIFFVVALLLVFVLILSARQYAALELLRGWSISHWHFAFLGAAFMLLEVQNISKASVVFGNTWSVNAVIISGILCMILCSNLVARYLPRLPTAVMFVGIAVSTLYLYWTDLAVFAFMPNLTKIIVVGGLSALPIFFSGVVFIRSFANAKHKDSALGANLFGALCGGVLQAATFIIGIRALLLVVLGLYVLAFLTAKKVVNLDAQKSN